MASEPSALALFIREPSPGTVKARLSTSLGPEKAARFYWECALLSMARALRLHNAEVFVFFRPVERRARIEELIMTRFGHFEGKFIPQQGGDPGERIFNALVHLDSLGFKRKFTLGTDSPTLPLEYLERGLRALDDADPPRRGEVSPALGGADCVLGPTWSGGFYLFGTKKPDAGVFRNVSWSSGLELVHVFDNASTLGSKCTLLPRWQDIDTPDDLEFLEGQVRQRDFQRLKSILKEGSPPDTPK